MGRRRRRGDYTGVLHQLPSAGWPCSSRRKEGMDGGRDGGGRERGGGRGVGGGEAFKAAH